jgi:transposase
LAALADGRIHATGEELTAALHGRVTTHHRFLVKLHLDQIDAIAQAIASIDREVDSQIKPFRQPAQMLIAIPDLGPLAALVVLAEIGLDMSHFPSTAHLISWAGLCPRNDESAGNRRSTRMRNGAPWLKMVRSNAPGQRRAPKEATSSRSITDCAHGMALRKRSARPQPLYSPPSITC